MDNRDHDAFKKYFTNDEVGLVKDGLVTRYMYLKANMTLCMVVLDLIKNVVNFVMEVSRFSITANGIGIGAERIINLKNK